VNQQEPTIIADMEKELRGLYRTVACAYVTNGTMSFQVREADYRAFGYEPDYDNLPWKDDYLAGNARASSV
jgi:hypothetical protein